MEMGAPARRVRAPRSARDRLLQNKEAVRASSCNARAMLHAPERNAVPRALLFFFPGARCTPPDGAARATESALRAGLCAPSRATNALELGVDVGVLDAALHLGFPARRPHWRQQAGRAGRRGTLGRLVGHAFDGPLDQYFMRRPEVIRSRRRNARDRLREPGDSRRARRVRGAQIVPLDAAGRARARRTSARGARRRAIDARCSPASKTSRAAASPRMRSCAREGSRATSVAASRAFRGVCGGWATPLPARRGA